MHKKTGNNLKVKGSQRPKEIPETPSVRIPRGDTLPPHPYSLLHYNHWSLPTVLSDVENPLAVVPASAPLLAAAPEPQRCRRGREVLIKGGFYWILNGLSRGTLEITVASSCSAAALPHFHRRPSSPQNPIDSALLLSSDQHCGEVALPEESPIQP
ncbi:hypothetical protein G5714_022676 [Onychostoma macrolepis]|uniref:Uncharacterized protein n=1 Tax=Onychostoma macrolepis TaxID=369639 RepID=A0A7J6BNU9_9TELE|nr:hypothetical protein G5714_022676 [Onychostoma macrolepis]